MQKKLTEAIRERSEEIKKFTSSFVLLKLLFLFFLTLTVVFICLLVISPGNPQIAINLFITLFIGMTMSYLSHIVEDYIKIQNGLNRDDMWLISKLKEMKR